MNKSLASLATLALSSAFAFAAKDAELKPAITTPGKSLLEAHFKSGALEAPWTIAKGDWVVLFLKLPARDSVIRFSYKLDGANKFELSYNQAKGHLFRVLVETDSLTVARDRDKKDEASKREPLAKTAAALPSGEWHTILVEVKGEQVEVQTDDGAKVELKNPDVNVDKTGYRFVMHGASLLLDDVRVWEVTP
jgi:hypothetical protein